MTALTRGNRTLTQPHISVWHSSSPKRPSDGKVGPQNYLLLRISVQATIAGLMHSASGCGRYDRRTTLVGPRLLSRHPTRRPGPLQLGSMADVPPQVNFLIKEVDADDDHYAEEILTLHDLTFFDPLVRPDLPRGFWWLVYDRQDWGYFAKPHPPVGFCGLTITPADNTLGYLKRAGVLKAYRGHGLQRKLITVRERKARKLGLTRMVTDTTENPASSNSLIRAGYKIFEPEYRWAFKHSIYWRKTL
jgi:GNAT superfamily N-acetyltransferase